MSTTTTTTTKDDKNYPEQGKPGKQDETVTSQASTLPAVEKQGEQVIDRGADAHVLKEQSAEERTQDAQDLALANHAAEHKNDEGDVTSRDRTDNDK